ncbi:MAG TPA: hypothetical protein VGQ76_11110 [Thermoanaerobaculia bacterium]|jgi:hypothetical protein|nr:hypothetical protein [Thermoanaerobaculia bacterium]
MPQRLIICLMFVIAIVTNAVAQESTTTTTTATAAASTTTGSPADRDSNETREALMLVLGKYPPQVSRVLKLDPSLFSNPAYLANYPALAAFLQEHPEVAHSPAFFLESIWIPNDSTPESANERVWRQTVESLSIFTVMLTVLGAFVWLIRTLIEHRRWSRLTKTQADVHGKLMDRLQSNEELLAYMQTPGGKRFLESAPIPMETGPRSVGAPINRILWSVQVGVILAMAGIGLQFISRSIDKVVAPPLLALGVLAMAIGAGFLLSAFVSYILSKRLGLLGAGATSTDAPSLSE